MCNLSLIFVWLSILSGLAGCIDPVDGTDCTEAIESGAVPPIVQCFEPRSYYCDTEAAVWRWETCCYCREPGEDTQGGSYCSPTCIDTGIPQ